MGSIDSSADSKILSLPITAHGMNKLIGNEFQTNVHVDDEGMIHAEQNVFLVLDVLDLFESDDVGDGQDLERPILPRALFTAQHNSSERSGSWT